MEIGWTGGRDMFTFAVITYNHEDIILEHLESIKYQIKHYGEGKSFYLIVSDDASVDRTLFKIEHWLEINSTLFSGTKILFNTRNQGIVKNYNRAVESIETAAFKVLAGDDLYYSNNIMNVMEGFDLVFTPVIQFHEKIIQTISTHTLLTMRYCNPDSFKNLLEYSDFISAPGVFIKKEIAQDSKLLSYISQFKWVEDYAKWYYLFHTKEDLKIIYNEIPKILYRIKSGVSSNTDHVKRDSYLKEVKKVEEIWSLKPYRYPKYINPYNYHRQLLYWKIKLFDAKMNATMKENIRVLEREMKAAEEFLKTIRQDAKAFENMYFKGE